MKPKYKQNLRQLISYLYPERHDYKVKIFINNDLKYNNSMELIDDFGYGYLNIVEYYYDNKTKTIFIYTEDK